MNTVSRPTGHRAPAIGALLAALLLAGCATPGAKTAGQRLDPWENWNRKVYRFNEKLDQRVLEPVATAYSNVVPHPVRKGVDNFFNNFRDAWSGVNNALQLKAGPALHSFMRVGANTVFGLGGVLDFATEFGLERHPEDLGQTLGHWGVGPGAYVVLPLLGPSTVRDTVALPFDRAVSPEVLVNGGGLVTGLTVLHIVNARAGLLQATNVIDQIALDKYTFVRDAYLQRRRSLVLEGRDDARGNQGADAAYAPAEDASTDGYAPPTEPADAPAAPAPGARPSGGTPNAVK